MMKSLENILNMAASGMSAESIKLNTIASNLANAGSVGSSEDTTYRSKNAIFSEIKSPLPGLSDSDQPLGGVRVSDVKSSTKPLQKRYEPNNPMANNEGFVFVTDVNPIEQMTNMIEASRSYQANVEIMNSTKSMIQQTIGVIASK
jgi:flagellar basal-body rod protein FlgC